jgi:hypothetical protein
MNKKILAIFLLTFVMLATPLIVAVQVGFGKSDQTVATFTWDVQQWPLNLVGALEDTKQHTTQKGDWIVQNVYTYGGGPPVAEVEWMNIPGVGNIVTNPGSWGDYPVGGIRLAIDDGTNEYVLTGDFSKTEIVFIQKAKMDPEKRGFLEVSQWIFEITAVEEVITGVAPVDAVGSTMSGTLRGGAGGEKIIGNKGTGIFDGAVLRGAQTIMAGAVVEDSSYVLFSWAAGSGEIVFP